ncbi:hypothetical protein [Anaerosporobacter sp.]|uniref:hypothetical protein n=1 Tax=Anaerosporobacter sp. TaxID=1872529 RepID=UPI00286EEB8A|nr:hypothetical protein [Anaerosporobacter sp.]
MEQQILVKYCFSELNNTLPDSRESYYSAIISKLLSEGIIENLQTYECESPFAEGSDIITYQHENLETYVYSFSCKEIRKNVPMTINFTVKFTYETYNKAEILYVEICSDNYTFSTESDSNCLEVLKHKLRGEIKEWNNRYCLVDKQSAFYASNLYPRIYEIENLFRYYVNDVFTKIFGANWWNENIAANIKKNRKSRIEDTREYAGQYKDIQPYLMSLELNDLMEIAKTKTLKWTPTYDEKVEEVLNHYSNEDLVSLLRSQCQPQIDIWNMCFGKHLSVDFLDTYRLFEKRRNQIAHNKLLDSESFMNIFTLCEKVLIELTTAYTKFCGEFISEEEQEMIEEYKADLAEQEAMEQAAWDAIAESESGVKVHSREQIIDVFNEALYEIYSELIEIFGERQDIDFDDYIDLKNVDTNQQIFRVTYMIADKTINVFVTLDINDSEGHSSELTIICELDGAIAESVIGFTNGEYSFNYEQTNYMPETQDELDEFSAEKTKKVLCNFIEENLPNLREKADIQNHLDAMGKSSAITERDVFCCECGEEYICTDDDYAPVGTCLNCGAKNYIIYCTYCQCPIEAVDIDEKDEEQCYCSACNNKLFGED